MQDVLEVRDINKTFKAKAGNVTAVDKVSLRARRGEVTVIVGPSGSGKTTLLYIIGSLESPDSGEINVFGEDVARSETDLISYRRQRIGFVFQFFNLIPTLTVLENVTLPLELKGEEQRIAQARAGDILREVGLIDRSHTFPEHLSGGEQQRVAIARALVHDPLLVLADEPTGNLDEETGRQVLALLDRLTRLAGKNLILVTHSREATSRADRILTLREGQLLENEKHPQ